MLWSKVNKILTKTTLQQFHPVHRFWTWPPNADIFWEMSSSTTNGILVQNMQRRKWAWIQWAVVHITLSHNSNWKGVYSNTSFCVVEGCMILYIEIDICNANVIRVCPAPEGYWDSVSIFSHNVVSVTCFCVGMALQNK